MTSIKEASVRIIILIWLLLLLVINYIFMKWCLSLAGRVNANLPGGSTWPWLPTLGLLLIMGDKHDGDKMETRSGHSAKDLPRNIVMHYGFTLARVLGFMHMSVHLSFWGNLIEKYWTRPILMVWSLVKGWWKQASDYLIGPSENNELFAHRSLPHRGLFPLLKV
ncbi:hypothetical protein F4604DRAFT_1903739 [Suillus subluteus]|nr:hypothetical protein F4604DRAFT_1903739 [Suillus subluteus]